MPHSSPRVTADVLPREACAPFVRHIISIVEWTTDSVTHGFSDAHNLPVQKCIDAITQIKVYLDRGKMEALERVLLASAPVIFPG